MRTFPGAGVMLVLLVLAGCGAAPDRRSIDLMPLLESEEALLSAEEQEVLRSLGYL